MPDTDLHTVARRMAAKGLLPGITIDVHGLSRKAVTGRTASEDNLQAAAMQYAKDRKWMLTIDATSTRPGVCVMANYRLYPADGTTALSVLLAVERAAQAAEATSKEHTDG